MRRRRTPRTDHAWTAITATLGTEIDRLRKEVTRAFAAWDQERRDRIVLIDEVTRLRNEVTELRTERAATAHALTGALGRHVDGRSVSLADAIWELAKRRSVAGTTTDTIIIDPTMTRRDLRALA